MANRRMLVAERSTIGRRRSCRTTPVEIAAVQVDHGHYLAYVRVVGRRPSDAHFDDLIVSAPSSTRGRHCSAARGEVPRMQRLSARETFTTGC